MCFDLGAPLKAIGSISAGNQAKQQATVQAGLLDDNAEQVGLVAAANESRLRTGQRMQRSQAEANIGASGVQVEGSPLEVLAFNAGQQELDALTIRYQGAREVLGLKQQAAMTRQSGAQAQMAGVIGAASSLLSTIKMPGFGGGGGSGLSGGRFDGADTRAMRPGQ